MVLLHETRWKTHELSEKSSPREPLSTAVVIKFTSISGVFGYPERQDSLQESHHERPETVLLTPAMLLRIEVVSFNHFQSVQGKKDVKRRLNVEDGETLDRRYYQSAESMEILVNFHEASILWLAQTLTSARGAISRMLDLIPAGDVIFCSILSEVFCSTGPWKWLVTVT